MAEIKKGIVKPFCTLLIVFLGMCLSSTQQADATVIKGIRTGSEQAYVRVVIETDAQIQPRPTTTVNRNTLQISLAGIEEDPSNLNSEAYRNDVAKVEVITHSTATRINATLAFIPIRVKTFFLVAPHRFVIDAYRPPPEAAKQPVDEDPQPISIIEESGILPNDVNDQELSPQDKPTTLLTERPLRSTANPADGSNPRAYQQRLLIFLIIVTSIILAVIIFLMCMGKGQQ